MDAKRTPRRFLPRAAVVLLAATSLVTFGLIAPAGAQQPNPNPAEAIA